MPSFACSFHVRSYINLSIEIVFLVPLQGSILAEHYIWVNRNNLIVPPVERWEETPVVEKETSCFHKCQ